MVHLFSLSTYTIKNYSIARLREDFSLLYCFLCWTKTIFLDTITLSQSCCTYCSITFDCLVLCISMPLPLAQYTQIKSLWHLDHTISFSGPFFQNIWFHLTFKSKIFSNQFGILLSPDVLFHIHISSQVRLLSKLLHVLSIDNLFWWGIMSLILNHVIKLLYFLLQVVTVSFYATNIPTPVHNWYQFQDQTSIYCWLLILSLAQHHCCPASFLVLHIEVHIQYWFFIFQIIKQQVILLFFLCSSFFGISSNSLYGYTGIYFSYFCYNLFFIILWYDSLLFFSSPTISIYLTS